MTKKVKGRILKAALTLAAVCALTVPSMTIRADKTAEAGDDTQVIQTAVQVQDTVQPSGTGQAAGEETVPLPVADPEEYTGQLQDIRQILQTQLEQVQLQIQTLTQLQEASAIDAAQLQLLGQLQALEQTQVQQIAMTDAQIEAFMGTGGRTGRASGRAGNHFCGRFQVRADEQCGGRQRFCMDSQILPGL